MSIVFVGIIIAVIVVLGFIGKKLWDKWEDNKIVIFDMPQDARILEKIPNEKYKLSEEEK